MNTPPSVLPRIPASKIYPEISWRIFTDSSNAKGFLQEFFQSSLLGILISRIVFFFRNSSMKGSIGNFTKVCFRNSSKNRFSNSSETFFENSFNCFRFLQRSFSQSSRTVPVIPSSIPLGTPPRIPSKVFFSNVYPRIPSSSSFLLIFSRNFLRISAYFLQKLLREFFQIFIPEFFRDFFRNTYYIHQKFLQRYLQEFIQ